MFVCQLRLRTKTNQAWSIIGHLVGRDWFLVRHLKSIWLKPGRVYVGLQVCLQLGTWQGICMVRATILFCHLQAYAVYLVIFNLRFINLYIIIIVRQEFILYGFIEFLCFRVDVHGKENTGQVEKVKSFIIWNPLGLNISFSPCEFQWPSPKMFIRGIQATYLDA